LIAQRQGIERSTVDLNRLGVSSQRWVSRTPTHIADANTAGNTVKIDEPNKPIKKTLPRSASVLFVSPADQRSSVIQPSV
jgi:hypothetical protein